MFRCTVCGIGKVQIDTDSFNTLLEKEDSEFVEMSTEVKGYCLHCEAEHTFTIQGYADVKIGGSTNG
jgi:hypothetical protein